MHFIHCHCPMASALSRLCRHAALPPKSSEIRPASPAPLESSFFTSPRKAMPARRCRRTTTRDDGAIKASVSEHFRLSHDASPPMLAVPRLWRCPDGLPWFGVQARARSSGIEIVDSWSGFQGSGLCRSQTMPLGASQLTHEAHGPNGTTIVPGRAIEASHQPQSLPIEMRGHDAIRCGTGAAQWLQASPQPQPRCRSSCQRNASRTANVASCPALSCFHARPG